MLYVNLALILLFVCFVSGSVSMNKRGDLLLNSLLQGDVVISSSGDIVFQNDVTSISLLRLIDVMNGVAGQICWDHPKKPPATWQVQNNLPTALSGSTVAVIGSTIYVMGGTTPNNMSSSSLFIYDTQVGTWRAGGSLIYPRSFPFAAPNGDGSKIYLFGGFNMTLGGPQDVSVVEVYDVYTDQWTSTASVMPINHRYGCASSVNNIMYFFGGVGSDGITPYGNVSSFDLNLGVWNTSLTSMISPRSMGTCFAINNLIYFAGGNDGTFESNAFDSFDTTTNSWTSLDNMAGLPSSGSCSAVLEGLAFIMGGETGIIQNESGVLGSMLGYNPRIDTWSIGNAPSLTFPRMNCATAVVLGNIYIIGGEANGTSVATVESISPCF